MEPVSKSEPEIKPKSSKDVKKKKANVETVTDAKPKSELAIKNNFILPSLISISTKENETKVAFKKPSGSKKFKLDKTDKHSNVRHHKVILNLELGLTLVWVNRLNNLSYSIKFIVNYSFSLLISNYFMESKYQIIILLF